MGEFIVRSSQMGQAKRELERRDHLRSMVEEAYIRAGWAERCDHHEEIVIDLMGGEPDGKVYAIATNMWKSGEVDVTRAEFMDAIKEGLQDADTQCNICANMLS